MNIKNNLYPWDLWLNGEVYKLERGIHFSEHIQVKNFRTQCYLKAKARGISITTECLDENTLIIKAIIPGKELAITLAEKRAELTHKFDVRELVDSESIQLTDELLKKLDDKKEIELIRHRDYDIPTEKAISLIYNAAKRAGRNISKLKYAKKSNGVVFYVEEVEYKFDEWFSQLTTLDNIDWDRLVDELELDDEGKPIPEMQELAGQWFAIPGKYKTRKVVLRDSRNAPQTPNEELILKFPQDFTCSSRKMAAIIQDEADDRDIDISSWYFDFKDKNILRIYCGSLAVKMREKDNEVNLLKISKKDLNPIKDKQVDVWLEQLYEEKYLQLFKGVDYLYDDDWHIASIIKNRADKRGIIFGSVQIGAIGETGDHYGITISLRKPLLYRNAENLNKAEFMARVDETKALPQPMEQQKIEQDRQKLLLNDTKFDESIKKYEELIKQFESEGDEDAVEGLKFEIDELRKKKNESRQIGTNQNSETKLLDNLEN